MITRILSGTVMIVLAVAVVWFAPPWLFLVVGEFLLVLACRELAALARASGLSVPEAVSTVAAALTALSFARVPVGVALPLDVVLMTAFTAVGASCLASWRGGADAVASVSAALLPPLYVGLPIGAMLAIRERGGPAALFLLMLTVMVSDSGQ